jgi:hypothetical protein
MILGLSSNFVSINLSELKERKRRMQKGRKEATN